MRGTLTNRGTKSKPNWWVSVHLGYGADGKRLRHQERGGPNGTKAEAEARLAELIAQRNGGTFVAASKLTIEEYLRDIWLPSVKPSLRTSTFEGYAALISKHIGPGIGSVKLQKLSVSHLDAWYASLLTSGRRDGKGGLSRKSVQNAHRVIRKSLGDAVRKGLLSRNVADFAQVPKDRSSGDSEMRTWTGDQLADFLDFVADNRLAPLFDLAAGTGMRRGELLGLRWEDVDLDRTRLAIRQTLLSVGNVLTWSTPKTPRSRRSVGLDSDAVASLRAWKVRQAQERLAIGAGYSDLGLVFCKPDGSPLHPSSVSQAFDRLVTRSGLPAIRFHDLRHTHATLALQAGIHPKIVSERLGHSTVTLTLDVYSHLNPDMDQDAAQKIADTFRRKRASE